MKFSEALLGARGHIAWILALTFSTIAIFHLENLSIASQEAAEREAAMKEDARLSAEARGALAEAEARRRAIDARGAFAPKETGGRGGLEPGRYGDWEIKGLTSDF